MSHVVFSEQVCVIWACTCLLPCHEGEARLHRKGPLRALTRQALQCPLYFTARYLYDSSESLSLSRSLLICEMEMIVVYNHVRAVLPSLGDEVV